MRAVLYRTDTCRARAVPCHVPPGPLVIFTWGSFVNALKRLKSDFKNLKVNFDIRFFFKKIMTCNKSLQHITNFEKQDKDDFSKFDFDN